MTSIFLTPIPITKDNLNVVARRRLDRPRTTLCKDVDGAAPCAVCS